jgi:hypothetical protein
MINREKRPYAEPQDLSFYTGVESGLPWHKLKPLFGTEHYPKIYSVYGDEWTCAYRVIFIERMEREIYRTISVNVNDPFIREAIELSFRFFQGRNFAEEGKQLDETLERLTKYIEVIKQLEIKGQNMHQNNHFVAQLNEQNKIDHGPENVEIRELNANFIIADTPSTNTKKNNSRRKLSTLMDTKLSNGIIF